MEVVNYNEKEQQIIAMREDAQRQLAAIKTIDEGAKYLSKVKALEAYARATKQDAEIVLMVQEQKLRSMRILGKLLEETEISKNASNQYLVGNEEVPSKPRLADLGITKNESSAYQKIASIPEEVFEQQIEAAKEQKSTTAEITTSGMLRVAQQNKDADKREKTEVGVIDLPRVCPYDSNMFYESAERSEARYGDKMFSLQDDKYNTVSTLSRFFHSETGMEFTLREYAQVQTFPDNFKFVGNYSTIKKQIGNAVAPHMGKFITKLVQGKTIGDLFAGCGGFSCGAHQNGFSTKWAVEWDEYAAKSFKLNFPDAKVYQTNIKALDPSQFERVDVIIGGPPCQGFSSANHENKKVRPEDRFADDPRNELYKEFLRFVQHLQPAQFIMENVPEIQDVKDQIVADFTSIGYVVETRLVEGNSIGMKQNRKRFFFIGTKI